MKRWKDTTQLAIKAEKLKAINLYLELGSKKSGLSAKFTLIKPNQTTVTKTLYTDLDGKAVSQFSLGTTYLKGTYKGQVTVDGKTVSGTVVI